MMYHKYIMDNQFEKELFQEIKRFMESYNSDVVPRDRCNVYDAMKAVASIRAQGNYYENVAELVESDIRQAQGDDIATPVDRLTDELTSEFGWDFDEVMEHLLDDFQDIVEPLFNERLTYTSLNGEECHEVIYEACKKWALTKDFETKE